jgi:hypothetical protein
MAVRLVPPAMPLSIVSVLCNMRYERLASSSFQSDCFCSLYFLSISPSGCPNPLVFTRLGLPVPTLVKRPA